MKIKNVLIIVTFIILASFTLGATGVISIANNAVPENLYGDRLIGVLITKDLLDLFDDEKLFEDNIDKIINGETIIDNKNSSKYMGRLYATRVETSIVTETGDTHQTTDFVFEGVDGIRFIMPFIKNESDDSRSFWTTNIDEGIMDANTGLSRTDAGEGISLKGTVYVNQEDNTGFLYLNPVYQTASGEVYVMSDGGSQLNITHKRTVSSTEKLGNKISTFNSSVEIATLTIKKPIGISLLQFNEKNELLEKADYIPGSLPERIDSLPGAQYIIVETTSESGVSREIFQRGDKRVIAFHCRDDGICIKRGIDVTWNN